MSSTGFWSWTYKQTFWYMSLDVAPIWPVKSLRRGLLASRLLYYIRVLQFLIGHMPVRLSVSAYFNHSECLGCLLTEKDNFVYPTCTASGGIGLFFWWFTFEATILQSSQDIFLRRIHNFLQWNFSKELQENDDKMALQSNCTVCFIRP